MAAASLRRLTVSRSSVSQRCMLRGSRRCFATGRTFCAAQKRATENVLDLLESRGYVKEIAGDRKVLDRLLQTKQVGVYAGIDPTAPSLHLGHLLPLMVLFWLYNHGHHTVSLVGGATARVGDPSGRLTSRERTASSVQISNFESLYGQVGKVWETASKYGRRHGYEPKQHWKSQLLDNADWLLKLNVVSFLQMLGSGMRIGTMLGRDTVKNKMEKGDGMSFAEFTYPLLQAWDWWHMYKEHDIQLQVGGSDQYGNIIAGMDAIKHIAQNDLDSADNSHHLDASGRLKEESAPMGITVPLLTTASGEKFGKSAGNAIWLDKTMTSPFDLYGFLLRSSDEDVGRYLKLFTFVPLSAIEKTMEQHSQDPGKRLAQHLLASEVLELVHGSEEAVKTRAEHQAMRNPSLSSLLQKPSGPGVETSEGQQGSEATKRTTLPRSLMQGASFTRVLWHAGLASTKSEAARLIKSGGVYVASGTRSPNGSGDESVAFTQVGQKGGEDVASFVRDDLLVVRLGKWKVRVVEILDDEAFEKTGGEAPGWQEWKESRC